MTVRAYYDVFCDNCGDWNSRTAQLRTAREALAGAKESGWRRIRDGSRALDLCPACRAKRIGLSTAVWAERAGVSNDMLSWLLANAKNADPERTVVLEMLKIAEETASAQVLSSASTT